MASQTLVHHTCSKAGYGESDSSKMTFGESDLRLAESDQRGQTRPSGGQGHRLLRQGL